VKGQQTAAQGERGTAAGGERTDMVRGKRDWGERKNGVNEGNRVRNGMSIRRESQECSTSSGKR